MRAFRGNEITSEYIEALKQTRERLIPQRRACVTVLAGSIEGRDSLEARATFHSLQATIEALDRAIDDERKIEDKRRQLEGAKEVRKRRIEHTSGLDSDD